MNARKKKPEEIKRDKREGKGNVKRKSGRVG